jgi:hypothetical protein
VLRGFYPRPDGGDGWVVGWVEGPGQVGPVAGGAAVDPGAPGLVAPTKVGR